MDDKETEFDLFNSNLPDGLQKKLNQVGLGVVERNKDDFVCACNY